MMQDFNKIIELINKTGDNCIVVDQKGNPAYVVLTLAKYEKLVLGKADITTLTEEELLEKINHDIALWKATQETEKLDNWQTVGSVIEEIKKGSLPIKEEKQLNVAKNDSDLASESEKYYFEPID